MTLHATHAPAFDATCADCWSRVEADNVTYADPIRPPATDEEPWAIEPDPVVTVAGWLALAVILAIVAAVILARWPR
jgi:hypothetical protein